LVFFKKARPKQFNNNLIFKSKQKKKAISLSFIFRLLLPSVSCSAVTSLIAQLEFLLLSLSLSSAVHRPIDAHDCDFASFLTILVFSPPRFCNFSIIIGIQTCFNSDLSPLRKAGTYVVPLSPLRCFSDNYTHVLFIHSSRTYIANYEFCDCIHS